MISMRGLNKNRPALYTERYGSSDKWANTYLMLWDGKKSYVLSHYSHKKDALRGAKRLWQRLSIPYIGHSKYED